MLMTSYLDILLYLVREMKLLANILAVVGRLLLLLIVPTLPVPSPNSITAVVVVIILHSTGDHT